MHGLVIDDPKMNFSSSHFITEHDKCERLHGHNYRLKIELCGELDENFMIMDFNIVKKRIKQVCEILDHRVLLPLNSPIVKVSETEGQVEVSSKKKFYSIPSVDCVMLPIESTTAEQLAKYIFEELAKSLPSLEKVCVSESEGSAAYFKK